MSFSFKFENLITYKSVLSKWVAVPFSAGKILQTEKEYNIAANSELFQSYHSSSLFKNILVSQLLISRVLQWTGWINFLSLTEEYQTCEKLIGESTFIMGGIRRPGRSDAHSDSAYRWIKYQWTCSLNINCK